MLLYSCDNRLLFGKYIRNCPCGQEKFTKELDLSEQNVFYNINHPEWTISKEVETMYLVPKISEIRTRRLDAGLSQHTFTVASRASDRFLPKVSIRE